MTFRMHPLHTADRHFSVMRDQGVLGYHKWLEEKRGTGRSTALMLKYIAAAIESPHLSVLLQDHAHPQVHAGTHKREFAVGILRLVETLGLKHMDTQLRNGHYYLTFGEPA